MKTVRPILVAICLFNFTTVTSQISLSAGIYSKIQSGNKINPDNAGDGWFMPFRKCDIREHYIVDNYSLGIDFQRNQFNLSMDALLSVDKLSVNSYYGKHYGYQTGTKSTQQYTSHSVNYGYLGCRISPQVIYSVSKNVDIQIGPVLQVQFKLYEREYNHYDSVYKSQSFYYGSTSSFFESSSANTNEFDGMNFSPVAVKAGLTANTKFRLNRFQLALTLGGGVGFTSRMSLRIGSAAWEDKLYGYLELGTKFSYRIGKENHTIKNTKSESIFSLFRGIRDRDFTR